MIRSARSAWIFAAFCVTAVAASAFAAVNPVGRPVVAQPAPAVVRPIHAAPVATPLSLPGSKVPLSMLARLPRKTALNTVTPKMLAATHGRMRPFSASGAYIDITNTTCGGALGDDFPVGCALTWQAEAAPNATDTKQDYYIFSNNGDELIAALAGTKAGGTYTAVAGASHSTTLSSAGTYILGTYDTTTSAWINVIYVNAGTAYEIQMYSDPFHTSETYQFNASTGTNAYLYLQNVAASDYYVVGVVQTAVNPNCVFMAPVPLPSPYTYPSNQLCNLSASAGVQAPGGDLSITWPLSSSYTGGTYSVEVYDLTAGQRVAQVQVAITSATGIVLTTYPDGTGANVNPSPAAVTATPDTIVDYDGGANPGPGDESVSGLMGSATGVANGTYTWSLVDPQGAIAGTSAATISGNAGTHTFTFDTLTGGGNSYIWPPAHYPAKSWVMQLYNTTSKTVAASQAFTILGYATQTQFNKAGTVTSSMALTPAGTTTGANIGLRITNTSSTIFNGYGDNLVGLDFSTGGDFNHLTTNGKGVFVTTSATALCTPTCSTTAMDSNNNTWNVTITCSGSALTTNGECNIVMLPASSTTYLAPGSYLEVDNLYWLEDTGAGCGDTCQGITSELPQHGLKWSLCASGVTGCASSTLAQEPTYFNNASLAISGTVNFKIIGSSNLGTQVNLASPYTKPFLGAHWFYNYFEQADYDADSPFQVANSGAVGSSNMYDFNFVFNNTSTPAANMTSVAVELPAQIHSQGFLSVPAGWTNVACGAGGLNTSFPSGTECFTFSTSIGKGTSSTQSFLQSVLQKSIPFQEIVVFGEFTVGANTEWVQLTPVAGTNETPDGVETALDNLSVGFYSLTAADMTAAFSPNTVGTGATSTLGFSFGNTSTSVDPNPDSIDALVLEAPETTLTINTSGATFTPSSWQYLGKLALGGGDEQYWFGLCNTNFATDAVTGAGYAGPPTAIGGPGQPTAAYPKFGQCTLPESGSIQPGGTLSVSGLKFSGFTSGSQTWHMYAHGANAGGWSSAQNMPLTVTTEAASVQFNQVNGTTVATNKVPTIGSSPNSYQYAITNTSSATNISTILITLPGTDINGQNAYDGTTAWNIANIDTTNTITVTFPAGQSDGKGGCAPSTLAAQTFNPTNAGVSGQIEITGCTTFKPGDTIYVNFTATNPSAESDSYVFPATVDGTAAGVAWLGATTVLEQFSIGLDVTVDPSNPGPGGSTPVVSCSNACSFSGTTIDFGNIADGVTDTFQDVVRASVFYTGTTSAGHNLDLFVSASANPLNELLTEADSARSTTGITFNSTGDTCASTTTLQTIVYPEVLTNGYCVMDTSNMFIAAVPENSSTTPYDILNSFEIAMGASDTITARTVTVTYTLIAN